MTLFIIGYVTYGATLVFYAAAFPRLARNTSRTRELEARYRRGEINKEELDLGVSLEKNRISNISTVKSAIASSKLSLRIHGFSRTAILVTLSCYA